MKENIREQNNKITKDWLDAFPQLTKYAKNKYYKVLGPLLIGIELIKLPNLEEYRPHFVIYSLWGNKVGDNLKACLSGPLMIKEFYDRKGFQLSIPYLKHEERFSDVLKLVKKQLPFSLEGNVASKKIFTAIDKYSKTPPLNSAPNSYLQASLQVNKLEIAICSGEYKISKNVLTAIKKEKWDLEHFTMCNVSYEDWIKEIETKLNNKDKLLSKLNINKQDKKLEKLKYSELS